MQEERRLITVLVADLTGATPLGERLDPEEVRLIIGEVIGRIVQIVEGWGGTVKDVAGDGVFALFGAPLAHEDDAERAVRAGLQIAQEAGRVGQEVGRAWGVEGLGVRVGVHTGPVALGTTTVGGEEQRAAFGDTLNTAARLQAAALPNTVLVGETTRRMVEPLFEWGAPQQPDLKGKSRQIVAYQAVAARAGSRKVRGLEGIQARFIGRQREMETARAVMDAVFSGSGRILFVVGEPGIGKSRLSLELRDLFEHTPAPRGRPLWMEGRCVSYGESLPYWPYRDLLREWLRLGGYEPELRARVVLRRRIEHLFPRPGARTVPLPGRPAGSGARTRRGCPPGAALTGGAAVSDV